MQTPKSLPRVTKFLMLLIASHAVTAASLAQDQVGRFIQAAEKDGNKLVQAFADPFLKRHGDGWADGWTYSAVHEKFTFQLVSVSASFVSEGEKTFDASQIGLSSDVRPVETPINQTFAGGHNDGNAGFDIYGKNVLTGQDQKITSFDGPSGLNLVVLGKSAVPTVVSPQIGFGILPNTEVMVRLIPGTNFGKTVSATVIGLGVKQGLNDYVFGSGGKSNETTAPVDLAGYAGYSLENFNYKLSVSPSEADKTRSGNEQTDYSHQRIRLHSTNFTIGGIVSKKYWIITPHAGLAFSSSKTTVSALGTYPVTIVGPAGLNSVRNVVDPFLVAGSHTGLSGNIGVNVNLYHIKINTEFILAKYSRLNAAISLYF